MYKFLFSVALLLTISGLLTTLIWLICWLDIRSNKKKNSFDYMFNQAIIRNNDVVKQIHKEFKV
jgi:hypothetical protein